jgi:hypothetical protein
LHRVVTRYQRQIGIVIEVVFGVYLFARPFFWEDVFSMAVLALHTAYLVALATGALGPHRPTARGHPGLWPS